MLTTILTPILLLFVIVTLIISAIALPFASMYLAFKYRNKNERYLDAYLRLYIQSVKNLIELL